MGMLRSLSSLLLTGSLGLALSITSEAANIPRADALYATNVTRNSARLWARITDDGEADCSYAFVYYPSGMAHLGKWTTWNCCKRTGDLFYADITEEFLRSVGGTTIDNYEFAAFAKNVAGMQTSSINASFDLPTAPPMKYTLTLSAMDGGYIVSPGQGVFSCTPGESVDVEAEADPGYEFTGWAGDFTSLVNPTSIKMDGDRTVTANFAPVRGDVVIKASGAAPNVFSACGLFQWGCSFLSDALESGYPKGGLIIGDPDFFKQDVCGVEYHFWIVKPAIGTDGLSEITVDITGTVDPDRDEPKVYIGPTGPYRPTDGNLHKVFTQSEAIHDILTEDPGESALYKLVIHIDASNGVWDVNDVYVCYKCPSIPKTDLQIFNDHDSIYRALSIYANDESIRKLYNLKGNEERLWEAVATTIAYAQDLTEVASQGSIKSAENAFDRFRELLDLLTDAAKFVLFLKDYGFLVEAGPEDIVPALDRAKLSGGKYIASFKGYISDGLTQQEWNNLEWQRVLWENDLIDLKDKMTAVLHALSSTYNRSDDTDIRTYAEFMIRCMNPWIIAGFEEAADGSTGWKESSPGYLDEAISRL